jgi:hypothetical protein
MNEYLRVTATCTNAKKASDHLYFDLRFSDGEISKRLPIFGWQNDAGYSTPFVVTDGGQVDFGAVYKAQQYGRTDLFRCEIAIGNLISWFSSDYEEHYKITSVRRINELV